MKRLILVLAVLIGSVGTVPGEAAACNLRFRPSPPRITAPLRVLRALRPQACDCRHCRRLHIERSHRRIVDEDQRTIVERSVVRHRTVVR